MHATRTGAASPAPRTLDRLWARYLAAREVQDEAPHHTRCLRALRDRLVAHYAPLAGRVARQTAPKPPPPFDADDVVAWGMAGLLDAVETFDPGRGARFETYAFARVRWRVLDEVRRADPLPRSAHSRIRAAEDVRSRLRQILCRAPTDDEVATALGTKPRHLRDLARRELASSRLTSLDSPVGPPDGVVFGISTGLHEVLADHPDDPGDDPQAALELVEARERIAEALGVLDPRSRFVVTSYFHGDSKLREIGVELGLTEGRISQILHSALDALRNNLAA